MYMDGIMVRHGAGWNDAVDIDESGGSTNRCNVRDTDR